MHIKSIKIKNFKCFDEQEVYFDSSYNLIIGENNSGKSTLFEALRLWQLAIQQFYTARTQKKSNNLGFYKRYNYRALEIKNLAFLRIQNIKDVFNNQDIPFSINICFSNGNETASVPISFKLTSRNSLNCNIGVDLTGNTKFELKDLQNISDDLFKVLDIESNDTFRNRIRLAYVPPKFTLPNVEVLLSEKNEFISTNLVLGKSQLVIRNILHPWCELTYRRKTKSAKVAEIKAKLNQLVSEEEFNSSYISTIKPYIEVVKNEKLTLNTNSKKTSLKKIENGLKEILHQDFDFKSFQDPTKTSELSIKNSSDKIEISQLGSGTINVLNILSVLEYNNQTIDKAATKANILLLDEPDSHLHSNLQNKLFKYLEKQSKDKNTQILIITHNSNLISQFEKVLFFQKDKKITKPITVNEYLENHLINMDHNQYSIIKSLNEARIAENMLQNQLNKSNETVILFEGNTDIKIFKVAFTKLYGKAFPFKIKEKISQAGQIPPVFNGHNNPNGFLIGIFDNDHAGRSQFKNIDNTFTNVSTLYKCKDNALAMLLPISIDRDLPFYRHNFTVEYLFSDESLSLMKVDLIQDKGESYKKIKPKNNTQAYCIDDSEKQKIATNCSYLNKEAFSNFIPIFNKIFEFTNYSL